MGVCHADNQKKIKKTDDNTKTQTNEEKKEDNVDSTKLKSGNNRLNHPVAEYKLNIIDASNTEYKYTIKGEQTLGKILKDTVNYNPNSDFSLEFENFKSIKTDKKDMIFSDILREVFDNNIPEIINMKYTCKGLDLPENVIKAYAENNKIIGSAIIDNPETFGIITYETNSNKISSYKYKSSEYPIINTFNNFTAYCNARNCLYFSGGENEQSNDLDKTSLKYNDFLYIDLSTLTEDKLNVNELPNLIEARTWHSMIFVPNKYIFIVGGSNTKSVELYDIEEKKLTEDSELNEIRCECTLCLVNNTYLYAFYGFLLHQDYNNSIERCNLLKEERKWENINVIENCAVKFKPSFFAISYFLNDNLLLIGGNDTGEDERNDYIYKFGKEENQKDEIEDYKFELKENLNIFKDKLFMPLENNKAVNIPLIIGGEIKVIILDTENGEVTQFNYDK